MLYTRPLLDVPRPDHSDAAVRFFCAEHMADNILEFARSKRLAVELWQDAVHASTEQQVAGAVQFIQDSTVLSVAEKE